MSEDRENDPNAGYGHAVPGTDVDENEFAAGHEHHGEGHDDHDHQGQGGYQDHLDHEGPSHENDIHEEEVLPNAEREKSSLLKKTLISLAILGAVGGGGYYFYHNQAQQVQSSPIRPVNQVSHKQKLSAPVRNQMADTDASLPSDVSIPSMNVQTTGNSFQNPLQGHASTPPALHAEAPSVIPAPVSPPSSPKAVRPEKNPFSGEVFDMIRDMKGDEQRWHDEVNADLQRIKEASQADHELLLAIQQSQSQSEGRLSAIEDSQKNMMDRLQSVSEKVEHMEGRIDSLSGPAAGTKKTETAKGDEGLPPSKVKPKPRQPNYQATVMREAPAHLRHQAQQVEHSDYIEGWRLKRAFSNNGGNDINAYIVDTPYGLASATAGGTFHLTQKTASENEQAALDSIGIVENLEHNGKGEYYLKTSTGMIWAGRPN